MSIAADRRVIASLMLEYRNRLDNFSEKDFMAHPPSGWCIAEVYAHVLQVNRSGLIFMEACIRGNAIKSNKPLHWLVWIILKAGRFPPGKFKAPANMAVLVKPISKEETRNMLIKVIKKLDELVPMVAKASLNQKMKHPRLGLLNARQWLRFIRIHTAHHLKQLDRIEKTLKNNSL